MKTRMGFISNSSSSNFVMVGYYTDDNLEDDIEVTLEDGEKRAIEGVYMEDDKGAYAVGIVISHGSSEDSYIPSAEIPVAKLSEMVKVIANTCKVEEKEIKLLCGSHPS